MTTPRIRVVALRQTGPAQPAHWEGRTDDGRVVYVRYHWGELQVGFGATLADAVADDDHIQVVEGPYDGVLSYAILKDFVPWVEWPIL